MEQEGWNYENANPNGRTIFVFRDTGHIVPEIQEKILREADRLFRQHFFNNLFVEGCQGVYYMSDASSFDSEEILKQKIQQERGKWSAVEILAYRLREEIVGQLFRIYGLEDQKLLERQKDAGRKVAQLGVKIKGREDTYEERVEFDKELQLFYSLTDQRTQTAMDILAREMSNLSINTAGLVFGEGHYKEMVELLKQKGIGYVSYYPGRPTISQESALEYALTL